MRGAIGFLVCAVLAGFAVDYASYGSATILILLALNFMMPAPPKGGRP